MFTFVFTGSIPRNKCRVIRTSTLRDSPTVICESCRFTVINVIMKYGVLWAILKKSPEKNVGKDSSANNALLTLFNVKENLFLQVNMH